MRQRWPQAKQRTRPLGSFSYNSPSAVRRASVSPSGVGFIEPGARGGRTFPSIIGLRSGLDRLAGDGEDKAKVGDRMIKPGVPAPNLAPLMGSDDVRERGGVRYREIKARSLLNRCDSPRMPFTWTVNPYRGCAMGCKYCYAAYTHEFLGIEVPEQFHSLVYVKTGAEDETARRLGAIIRRGELIALGTATDPYQPAEAEARVTRRFLEMVAAHRDVRLGIVTKGAIILRDLELLETINRRSKLWVRVSLISPHADLVRRLDPWAPPPVVRIDMMRQLHEAGIDAGLGLAPVLPALTDDEPSIDRLLG